MMFGWFKRTVAKVEQKIAPLTPSTLSNQELTDIFHNQKVCPDCGVWDFHEGPSGGMSVNIYCANCESWFNEQGPFGLDRLFKEKNFDLGTVDLDHSDNYRLYTWDILKDWHRVEIDASTKKDQLIKLLDAANWCATQDEVFGQWSIKDYVLYFEKETDAVAVKLKWV